MKFPGIDTFATGKLPVSDGNQIYWEASGNPRGKPALYLHGGPGSGIMTASAWCAWEDVHVSLDPKHTPNPRYRDPDFRLVFATLVIHYWKHAAFMSGAGILGNMGRISHIPGVLIHGRWDISSPLETAWELHKAWPASELVIIDVEGHDGETMADELSRAIARFSIV